MNIVKIFTTSLLTARKIIASNFAHRLVSKSPSTILWSKFNTGERDVSVYCKQLIVWKADIWTSKNICGQGRYTLMAKHFLLKYVKKENILSLIQATVYCRGSNSNSHLKETQVVLLLQFSSFISNWFNLIWEAH